MRRANWGQESSDPFIVTRDSFDALTGHMFFVDAAKVVAEAAELHFRGVLTADDRGGDWHRALVAVLAGMSDGREARQSKSTDKTTAAGAGTPTAEETRGTTFSSSVNSHCSTRQTVSPTEQSTPQPGRRDEALADSTSPSGDREEARFERGRHLAQSGMTDLEARADELIEWALRCNRVGKRDLLHLKWLADNIRVDAQMVETGLLWAYAPEEVTAHDR